MNIKIAFLIIILSLFLIITLQNTEVSTFKIFFWQVDMSHIVFMYLSILIGFVAGFVIAKFTGGKAGSVSDKGEKEKIE